MLQSKDEEKLEARRVRCITVPYDRFVTREEEGQKWVSTSESLILTVHMRVDESRENGKPS